MRSTHTTRRLALLAMPFVLAGLAAGLHALAPPPQDGVKRITAPEGSTVTWEGIDTLISEQKFEAAAAAVAELRETARTAGDNADWTRALVTEVQLRMGLHGYETAVRFLREQEWPDDAVSRAVLDLFYAHSLVSYAEIYSWEIRGRERVASDDEVDLKRWTLEQIAAEANRAFGRVWAERGQWGESSIGELARYIDQNDYPARIRGTLRDAVSYLWVELLADSSLWRPSQANQLYQLDVAALIAGDPARSGALDLADPRVHPLSKIGAVLDDLESWHRSEGRREAALEARLERLRRLHAALTSAHDKRAVREHLQGVQSGFDRSYEWWSMGQAELAEMLQGEDEADSLVRARQEALAGAERHPDSVGGARCRHLVAAIEAPSFSLEAMALDGAHRHSIRVTHRNLDALHFRAYAFDLADTVAGARDYNLLPGYREVPQWIADRTPSAAWTEELPATTDYRDHSTFVTPPMATPGAYLVVVSSRRDFASEGNQMTALNMVIGDLVLVTSQAGGGWEVTARSGGSGLPLADAEISLYRADWRRGHRLVDQKRTGIDGLVRFTTFGQRPDQYFLLARWQDHVAVDTSFLYGYEEPSLGVESSAFLYTDRSVYRPQQTIHWKVVAYRGGGDEQRYRTLPGSAVTVTLTDANGEEVASRQVTTNGFGSASGSFEIPPGRLLGAWYLRSSLGGATMLRVEEYKRPTFEVTVDDPAGALRLNRPAALAGSARYYFGLPVSTGDVAWRVTREPVYPRWWFWWAPQPAAEAEIVASGAASLDTDGRFAIGFTPAADERDAAIEGMSYRYRLTAEVTDEGGETRSATRVFRLGFVAVEARIESPLAFLPAREHAELKVHRSDLDGTPRAGAGEWRIVELVQPERALLPADEPVPVAPGAEGRFRTPGDQERPRWDTWLEPDSVMARWPEGRQIAAGQLTHGEDGMPR